MAEAPVALTSLSEEQRAEAYARFEILRPALTLRQAICRKEDPRWHAYGIPMLRASPKDKWASHAKMGE